MDQNQPASPGAATDEPASPSSNPAPALAAAPTPGTASPPRVPRRLRHDGWTPDRQVIFLESLATYAVVADACDRAGMSTSSAYAFRSRAAGAAFAFAWEAVLRHRARNGLADNMMSRAMHGFTEHTRDANGEVVSERHRFDNRLSMAMLTRLDRLAEGNSETDRHLRAVSADFDDLLDCIEEGGDAIAFVETRRPAPLPEPEPKVEPQAPQPEPRPDPQPPLEAAPVPDPAPPPPAPLIENDFDRVASLTGLLGYKEMNPLDIDLSDLSEHGPVGYDQMLRAHYSGYLDFRDCCEADRKEALAADEADAYEEADAIDSSPKAFTRAVNVGRGRFVRRKARSALRAGQQAAGAGTVAPVGPVAPLGGDASQPSTLSTCAGQEP